MGRTRKRTDRPLHEKVENRTKSVDGPSTFLCDNRGMPRLPRAPSTWESPLTEDLQRTLTGPLEGLKLTSALEYILAQRRAHRSTFVRSLAMAHMERVGSRDSKPVTDRVRAALDLMMHSGDANQVEVARALGLHERTLQRRLKGEGAAFEDIKDAVRRARAEEYLRQRELPLSQVAELLGYSEPAALSRSCRRWFGDTPKAVRRRLAA